MKATISPRSLSATLTRSLAGFVRQPITATITAAGTVAVAALEALARIAGGIAGESTVSAILTVSARISAAITAAGTLSASTTAGSEITATIPAAGTMAPPHHLHRLAPRAVGG